MAVLHAAARRGEAMPFEKVETQVDFPALERKVLQLWDDICAFDRLRDKNANGPTWSFLDGPITANNPMGVHHAWGRTYKDAYQRYHAMLGQRQRYQNGFDCQGLWVEVEVEKHLELKSKRDIENLVPGDRDASVAKFVQLCKDRVDRFARVQTEQSIRLGYWMDWDRTDADWAKPPGERKSYFTMSEENNYTIWAFLKKCHARGLVYKGYDVMPWCGRCGVGLAEQEVKEGYKLVEHKSAFIKLPLKERPGENLLVWTTTPWTLTSNVGAAVNPELTYLRVKMKGEMYYVAKGAFTFDRMKGGDEEGEGEPGASAPGGKSKKAWLDGVPHLKSIEQHFKEKAGKDGFQLDGEVKGSDLLGLRYEGPFDSLPAQQFPGGFPDDVARVALARKWAGAVSAADSHKVIDGGKDVTDTEGTGIVHTAPGCGQIDFQWGKDNALPPVAPLDEEGSFVEGLGTLTGNNAVDPKTADAVFDLLKASGRLFATERYVHRYPHCWRCKTELLYRLVDEWFINMGPRHTEEGFRGDIMRVVDQVTFLPPEISGRARERDWLWNMGDWMISKKRFWGLALPIWVDEVTGDFEVIGGRDELKARAVEGWEQFEGHTPHRPYIDKVKIRNPKTGNLMSRIPDVGNPWLDAGIVAYSTMGYNRDRAEWEKWFPADFITESFPGQFRNWFYALLAMSTMMEDRPPIKVLLGHGLVRDQSGEEMHKAKGNSIEFNGAADTGYELFTKREPKLKPEAQVKRGLDHGGLPDGYLRLKEGEKSIDGKPILALIGEYKPIGADVIRWLYCRQAPESNVSLGPGPADEIRSRFFLKLWNSYAFFCNYARLDSFDPVSALVPKPDMDRWLLASLQPLIEHARKAFDEYDVMSFCLEAEKFVDDKLSNWYVRRSKERFQRPGTDPDKRAAYQTLHEVLLTLAKLIAPVAPFLAETLYQNLAVNTYPAGKVPSSVHLCDYPVADPSLRDEALVEDMDAVLRLTTLGSAARNAVKIKVRQPLAELLVRPADKKDRATRRAVERFSDLISDELNVKKVKLHEGEEPLLTAEAKLNTRNQGKFGPRIKEAHAAVATVSPEELAALVRKGEPFTLAELEFLPEDITLTMRACEGWSGVEDRGTQVAIDTRITPELLAEGLARDMIRYVQATRKRVGLQMEDRISLYLSADDEALRQAIDHHWEYIAGETLATSRAATPPGEVFSEEEDGKPIVISGKPLSISLAKA
jgi:isoleucyl-tRNA synthetase